MRTTRSKRFVWWLNKRLGYRNELCHRCGRRVGEVWWCGDAQMWAAVSGETDGGGVLCSPCFERGASSVLRWLALPLGSRLDRDVMELCRRTEPVGRRVYDGGDT